MLEPDQLTPGECSTAYMKILLLTQEPPLRDDEIVSGNAVRTRQLSSALDHAGHEVTQAWLSREPNEAETSQGLTFRNRDDLQGLLMKESPDAVIVGYWELLGLLPLENLPLVVLDYVAPRALEELFESPETVRASLRRLTVNLRRCDLVLVGNDLQKHLLVTPLIEAGFDLSRSDPVRVVLLGAETALESRALPEEDQWLFVSGGVTWPWRQTGTYREVLERFLDKNQPRVHLVNFGGGYRWHPDSREPGPEKPNENPDLVSFRPLMPYREFSEFLARDCHVGLELAERNIERQYSQSFRSLEFLRHGLPLVCNRYLPFSNLIDQYEAGWVVDGPESLESLLAEIVSRPEEWKRRSDNALKLVSEKLTPDRTVKPLLDFLQSPSRPSRLAAESFGRDQQPVLGIPPLRERIGRQYRLARQVLLNRLIGQDGGDGILFVTRGDLFPADHGAAVRTMETAKALARAGNRVGIVTDERSCWYEVTADEVLERKYPFWARFTGLPGPLVKLLHYSKDLPHSNGFLYLPLSDNSFFWRTVAAASVLRPGILQAEFPAYALPCIKAREALDCKVVLVQHNVEYDRLRAQVRELTDQQYQNLRDIEIDLCNRSDAVVCVSDNDRQKLAEDGVCADILHTIPHGVDLAGFDSLPPIDVREKFGIPAQSPVLVYHGTFSYPPNREALGIFAGTLLPRLEQKGLSCHLLAVGRDPPADSPHPRIHMAGSVDHVAPWLKGADLALVPLVEGGGTRMKIIDYFAAGLPVLSTGKGIEGIPVVNGEHALVLDDWDAMTAAVIDLWENPERAKALAAEGRALAEGLSWDSVAKQYLELYGEVR